MENSIQFPTLPHPKGFTTMENKVYTQVEKHYCCYSFSPKLKRRTTAEKETKRVPRA